MKPRLDELCAEYLEMISESKKKIVEKSKEYLKNYDKLFTHCHSSTVEELIKELSHKDKNFNEKENHNITTYFLPVPLHKTNPKNLFKIDFVSVSYFLKPQQILVAVLY